MIKLIWAMDPNGVIGKNNSLPWHIKDELKHFSKTTYNNHVLFGRKTFESLPGILPNRVHLVLTRDKQIKSNNSSVIYCTNLKKIINKYKKNNKDLYIAGGSEIYKQTLPYADELIVTEIKNFYDGNIYFPEFDISKFELIKILQYDKFNVKYYRRKK